MMDEEIDRMVISVRADTAAFARDVSRMRGELEGPLVQGVGRAGRMIDTALSRAIASGKVGFDDLKKVALSAMADIASASLRALFRPEGGGGVGSGLLSGLSNLVAGLVGSPGRATGGPVSGGRAYMVGERGPELFIPSGSGRIENLPGGRARDVRVAISLNAPAGTNEPQALRQSSRQVARAVRSALRKDMK
jgi:phage-related minor tail protein